MAGFGETDYGIIAGKGESAQETGTEGDGMKGFLCWVDVAQFTCSGVEEPDTTAIPARGMGHGETVAKNFVGDNVHEYATTDAVLAPPFDDIGVAYKSGVAWEPGIVECQPVEMASVFCGQAIDERGHPEWAEGVVVTWGCETIEQGDGEGWDIGVHDGHIVDVDIPGGVAGHGDKKGVMIIVELSGIEDVGESPELET